MKCTALSLFVEGSPLLELLARASDRSEVGALRRRRRRLTPGSLERERRTRAHTHWSHSVAVSRPRPTTPRSRLHRAAGALRSKPSAAAYTDTQCGPVAGSGGRGPVGRCDPGYRRCPICLLLRHHCQPRTRGLHRGGKRWLVARPATASLASARAARACTPRARLPAPSSRDGRAVRHPAAVCAARAPEEPACSGVSVSGKHMQLE